MQTLLFCYVNRENRSKDPRINVWHHEACYYKNSDDLSIRTKHQWWHDRHEPPHDKTSEMICAPTEDSDQPGHPSSLMSLHSAFNGPGPRLIWVFAGHTVILLVFSWRGSYAFRFAKFDFKRSSDGWIRLRLTRGVDVIKTSNSGR